MAHRRALRKKDKSPAARFARLRRNPHKDGRIYRVPITLTGTITPNTSQTSFQFTYSDFHAATDYVSFASLYRNHRFAGMEIEILDLLGATSPTTLIGGTLHSGGALPTITSSLVQDLPDCANAPLYAPKRWHWIAYHPSEKLFRTTANVEDFGGWVAVIGANPSPLAKWRYRCTAVIEFSDRV